MTDSDTEGLLADLHFRKEVLAELLSTKKILHFADTVRESPVKKAVGVVPGILHSNMQAVAAGILALVSTVEEAYQEDLAFQADPASQADPAFQADLASQADRRDFQRLLQEMAPNPVATNLPFLLQS